MLRQRIGFWRIVESSAFSVERSLSTLLLLVLLVSCQAAKAEGQLLGPGDRLAITVWGEKDLSREVEVRGDGKFAFPLLGEIEAAGQSAVQLQTEMEKRLKDYLRSPRVEVAVISYAKLAVFVLGQVARPGAYDVPRGSGVMEVIALAGGALPSADKEASLLRANRELLTVRLEELVEASRVGTAPQLQPGDVLIVPFRRQAEQIAVMGQVGKPGMFPFTPGMRILDALGLAGFAQNSPNQPTRPDLSRVILTRDGGGKTIDVSRMLRLGDLEGNEPLSPGDILTVPEAMRKRVYTFGAFKSPGVYYLDPGQGLLEVILASGGPSEGAKQDKACLIRMVEGQPKTIPLDLGRLISRGDPSQNLPLENGDILFLPGARKSALRLEMILPFVPYLLF